MFAPLGAEAAIEMQSSITPMGTGRLLNNLADRVEIYCEPAV